MADQLRLLLRLLCQKWPSTHAPEVLVTLRPSRLLRWMAQFGRSRSFAWSGMNFGLGTSSPYCEQHLHRRSSYHSIGRYWDETTDHLRSAPSCCVPSSQGSTAKSFLSLYQVKVGRSNKAFVAR
ncbi:hypothetical protein M3J09_006954 [Ascochyta lentis]